MQAKINTVGQKKLLDWMEKHKVNINDLAIAVGVYYERAWHWVRGIRKPNLAMAIKIEKLTNQSVPCSSWYADIDSLTVPGNNPYDKSKKS